MTILALNVGIRVTAAPSASVIFLSATEETIVGTEAMRIHQFVHKEYRDHDLSSCHGSMILTTVSKKDLAAYLSLSIQAIS